MSGSPRGGIKAWQSLLKYVKQPLSADLAVSYGDKFILPKILKENATYDWKFKEPENWSDYFSNEYKGTWKEFLLLGKDLGMAGGIDNNTGSGAIVSGLKDIIYKNYMAILENYKYIIHTRFDQLYIDRHNEFDGEKIWIPEGEDYFGICDRHAIFPSSIAKEYFGICEYINDPKSLKNPPKKVTPESVFLENLIKNNLEDRITRIRRNHLTVALKSDNTRWRLAKYKIFFFGGTLMKYPDEFITSIYNYKKINGILSLLVFRTVFSINYFYLIIRRQLGKIKSYFIK